MTIVHASYVSIQNLGCYMGNVCKLHIKNNRRLERHVLLAKGTSLSLGGCTVLNMYEYT